MDDQVEQRLKNNPKVRVEGDQYAYQVRTATSSQVLFRQNYLVFPVIERAC